MVIFHVHKGCIRIGFTIIVSSLKACRMPVINGLPLKESVEKLEKEMREASKRLEFEYAAVLRDRIIELRGHG